MLSTIVQAGDVRISGPYSSTSITQSSATYLEFSFRDRIFDGQMSVLFAFTSFSPTRIWRKKIQDRLYNRKKAQDFALNPRANEHAHEKKK